MCFWQPITTKLGAAVQSSAEVGAEPFQYDSMRIQAHHLWSSCAACAQHVQSNTGKGLHARKGGAQSEVLTSKPCSQASSNIKVTFDCFTTASLAVSSICAEYKLNVCVLR